MSGNLRRRIEQAEAVTGAGKPCPECGYIDGEPPFGDEGFAVEVVWNDLEDVSEEEPEEEFCSTCGVQLSFTILWDDTPQAKRRWGEGA